MAVHFWKNKYPAYTFGLASRPITSQQERMLELGSNLCSIKTPTGFFFPHDKVILTFIWKNKQTRIIRNVLNNRVRIYFDVHENIP